jgi:hypothetical protein
MTRNDIIRMAREAGISSLSLIDVGYLERFAAMVAAAAKEEMLMAGNDQWLEEAREAEREAAELRVTDLFAAMDTTPYLIDICATIRAMESE